MQIVQVTQERRRTKRQKRQARLWRDTFREAQSQAMAIRSKEMEKFGVLNPKHGEFLMIVEHSPFFARYTHVNPEGMACGSLHVCPDATCPGGLPDTEMMLVIERDEELLEMAKDQYNAMLTQIKASYERLKLERRRNGLG